MLALRIDDTLRLDAAAPEPKAAPGEALLRVRLAGICDTDLQLVRGYMGFRGVPGHEFVGEVVQSPDPALARTRVVGEINAGCGACPACAAGWQRHCPNRTVLGILGRDGAHAELLTLPAENLHAVPAELSDELAVLTEPLAAAYEVVEQRPPQPAERWLVLGDGKLGLLVAAVLHSEGAEPLLAGRHEPKLALARGWGVRTAPADTLRERDWEVVVEATGAADGIERALALVRPRGTIVLKTTVAAPPRAPLAPIVVDEVTLIGSRCGPFARALAGFAKLDTAGVRLAELIEASHPLADGLAAYQRAATRGTLKILLRP
ncbi:MAG TPA: alcohol dehydrogenase catalytic domain-containing protein [Dehalococcoidia bacterium]|nr:alcohol dehydrogenase catalytic domain-containing protein [Dehalococcoidia bacterium]